MKGNPLVLVFDVGTQSTRALLFDRAGNLINKVRSTERLYISDTDETAEISCDDYWAECCEVSRKMREQVGDAWEQIAAVSVTAIRNTMCFLDKHGKQTRNAILWMDKREVECPDPMPPINRFLYMLVGMSEATRVSRRTSYGNWVRVNQPEVWAKTAKIVMPSAFFNFKLTGRLADSKAAQAAKIPYDYKRRKWQTEHSLTFPIFGCRIDQMCELEEPGAEIGKITAQAAADTGLKEGLPVIAAGSDKACETLGCGAVGRDVAAVSLGTASSVEITTDKYVEPESFMPPYTAVYPNKYNPEIQIFRGFWMVSWFKRQLALYEMEEARAKNVKVEEILDAKLETIPAGCHGLILQPLWGPGLKNPEAKGAIVGFSDVHTRIHIYRAIIEGIAYGLLNGLEELETRAKVSIKRVSLSGGGSQSDAVCQIMADVFGRPMYRVQTYETSGLGAAIITFTALGVYGSIDEAISNMSHTSQEYFPRLDNHQTYDIFFNQVYKKLCRNLQPVNDSLYAILGKYRRQGVSRSGKD